MAGSSSTPTMMLIVTKTPAKHLAFKNLVYCSSSDLHKFSVSSTKRFLVLVGEDGFVLSLSWIECDLCMGIDILDVVQNQTVEPKKEHDKPSPIFPSKTYGIVYLVKETPHDAIPSGHIALNAIQRRDARVSVGDTVSVVRFIPPADFNLAYLSLGLEFVNRETKSEQLDAVALANQLREKFLNQVLTVGQRVTFEYYWNIYIFTVTLAVVEGQENWKSVPERGMVSANTCIILQASGASGIKIVNQGEASSSDIFRHKEFNLEYHDMGCISAANKFQGAFASPVSPLMMSKWGITHAKRMLLRGPPGSGKTQVARQIGKMLNGKEPKIDGADSLNNVLLTGITNIPSRLGQLMAQVETSRPDESGRLWMFKIHTKDMHENSMLAPDVNLQELAARTRNYGNAEIEGVVGSAASFALCRQWSLADLTRPRVTMEDFLRALQEITPAYGVSTNDLEAWRYG